MNIGIFTDTYEPQINGVVTSIKTAVDYLDQNHNVYIFCPNSKPKLKSTEKFDDSHHLFTHFKKNIVWFGHIINTIKKLKH